MPHDLRRLSIITVAVLLGSCGEVAQLSDKSDHGPDPKLPQPTETLLPTVDVAKAVGWPEGRKPSAPGGLVVTSFADGLEHPRWMLVLPNGDVLVAESNAPDRPDDNKGVKAWVMGLLKKRAGAGVKSANRITLLRDANGDGTAEIKTVFASNLNSPFGMALINDTLYVANTDALVKFKYADGQQTVEGPPEKVADLPAGPINHHWTKNVIASRDGRKLYVTVGSNSNVAENGIDAENRRAGILEIDPATGGSRVFASGLRNPNGLAWEPLTGALWTTVNERDELGSDLVPDYMTSVRDGGFYGWPYSYFGQVVDSRVPARPELVAKAIKPDYALGAHTASLGLTFYEGKGLPDRYIGGAFIGQHGSWNRTPKSGYKVVHVPFSNGMPSGATEDMLTGFLSVKGEAYGRPVGVAVDSRGGLLVADDVGNRIWHVSTRSE